MMRFVGNQDRYSTFVSEFILSQEPNTIVVLPPDLDEINLLKNDVETALTLRSSMVNLFSKIKNDIQHFLIKKEGTVVFLFHPQFYEGAGDAYTPIQSHMNESFMKSLSKEMSAFNVSVFGVVLALEKGVDGEMELVKSKKTDMVTLKYKAFTAQEQASMVKRLIRCSDILRGQVVTLGNPLPLYR